MRRAALVIASLLAIVGCAEAPRGHEDPNPPSSSTTGGAATEDGPTTKIPMH